MRASIRLPDNETPRRARRVMLPESVKNLQAFRAFLENGTTRALFRNADQLGGLVATSLFPWLLQHAAPMRAGQPTDDVPSPVVPPDAPPQAASGAVRRGQNYWREQIHADSARELIAAPQRAATRPRRTSPTPSIAPWSVAPT
jgi:hypothetical protein